MKITFEDGKSLNAEKFFLNEISIAFMESAEWYKTLGCSSLAKNAYKKGYEIYKALYEIGFYNDVL